MGKFDGYKWNFFTNSPYSEGMAYEIELIFQDQKLHKLLRGRFKVQHGRLTVTAEDGTTKTLSLADAMARSVLHDIELEKVH
jgi:hypothetical protein